jgi:hypothetical protein
MYIIAIRTNNTTPSYIHVHSLLLSYLLSHSLFHSLFSFDFFYFLFFPPISFNPSSHVIFHFLPSPFSTRQALPSAS